MSGFFKAFSRMSKVERFGTLYLTAIIIIVALALILFEPVYNRIYPPVDYTRGFDSVLNVVEKEYRQELVRDSIAEAQRKSSKRRNYHSHNHSATEVEIDPFYFNPNKLPPDSLELLGFKSFVAMNIEKYRAAGGIFNDAEDLKKIYNIDEGLIDDLTRFMIFPEVEGGKSENRKGEDSAFAEGEYGSDQNEEIENNRDFSNRKKSSSVFYEFDLNEADTADLKKIKGIGPYYAGNILKYRELLGGYVDVDQLTEVYGISDSLYQSVALHFYIKDTFAPQKINLNEVSTYELSKHPYIKRHLAEMIVGYRYDKGKYKKTEDLIEHRLITSVQHARLKPYFTVK